MTAVAVDLPGWEVVEAAIPGWRIVRDDAVRVQLWAPTSTVGFEVDIIRTRPLDLDDTSWLADRLAEARAAMLGAGRRFEALPAETASDAVRAVEDAIDAHHEHWHACLDGEQGPAVVRALLELGWTPPPLAAP